MKKVNGPILFAAALVAIFSLFPDVVAFASAEISSPPAQVSAKRINLSVWSATGADELALSTSRPNEISVGGVKYNSSSETIFDVTRRRAGVGAKAIYNPSDTLDFRFSGFSGTQEIGIQALAGENTLTGDGSSVGFGLRKVAQPGTLVTTSVVIDYGADFSRARLDSMKASGGVSPINAVFTTAEYSLGVTFARRRENYEPWASLKISRVYSELDDRASFEKVSGARDR
ncbi:MAG: hypothetical protein QME32_08340, partial [Endomicrobiia bacterium]|nr:hypothetical protein [Endomicrobiia bacterium]